MSRSIKDRLVAALEARAELVKPEDLGPIEIPRRHWRPRMGAGLLLAAAATAAVVATPFVLESGGGVSPWPDPAAPPSAVSSPSESGPTATPSETPSEPVTGLSDLVVAGRQRADVDGDGRQDLVRLMLPSTNPDEPGAGAVEVSLASGARGAAEVPFGYPPDLLPAFDINGDGREQVLLSHTAGGDSAQLLVYTWHEGGLVRAVPDGRVPIALDLDGQGRVNHYYVDDRGLFSWQRLDPVGQAGGPVFKVKEWSWAVEADRLVPTPAGSGCVDVTSTDPPQRCTGQPPGR
jgi:hypothetical protein